MSGRRAAGRLRQAVGLAVGLGALVLAPLAAQEEAADPDPTVAVPLPGEASGEAAAPDAGEHHHPAPPAPAEGREREREYFSDVVLVNQDGESMRFYSDLLAGKTVVINAFFTSCDGVCPVMAGKLAKVQEWLGERLGDDVHLISLSVDPETDTPERLKEFAERFDARPGWYFLGGVKENVDWALYRVGQYAENREAHTNVLIVGNETARVWKKAFGLAEVQDLIRVVDETLHAGE